MYSLRKTLVLGTTLATATVFVVAGILLYLLMRASLLEQFDRALLEKIHMFTSAIEWERGTLSLEFDDLDMHEMEGDHPFGYLQLWRADGSTLYKSPGLGKSRLEKPDGRLTPACHAMQLPDGRHGRELSLAFFPHQASEERDSHATDQQNPKELPAQPGEAISLVFARSTSTMDEALIRLQGLLLLVGLTSIVLSTFVLWWLVRHSMRPLERLAEEIKRIDANDLSRSIGQETCPSELRPVVARLNDLLVRLDAAFRRERAFSANVSHELRNPLAALCLKMDIARSKTRKPQEYEAAIDDCREITTQMRRIVENLLSLARLEAGQIVVRAEPMCLDELIGELWKPLEAESIQRQLDVQWSVSSPLTLVSDASLVGLVMRNILENAVAYADEGGTVRICASSRNGTAKVSVSNSGSRLSQDQAELAFEQFWRGDKARTDAGVHCGLGLSLVKKAAAVLGGTVSVQSRFDGDFEISISFTNRISSHHTP